MKTGIRTNTLAPKASVRKYWEREPCGTRELSWANRSEFYRELERERYALEPYIPGFARFDEARGARLLEIGVGAGTDFVSFVRAGANATGIDLTTAGISLTRERLRLDGLEAKTMVADAENLPFPHSTFDIVYSYGVLHHSPDTEKAVAEVHRVLRPGGRALIMIYHYPSWTALMLWCLHCAARLRPWKSPRWAMEHFLESPGTKAYTLEQARQLFGSFSSVRCWSQLSHGDLLAMRAGPRYRGAIHRVLWTLYPRWLIRISGNRFGTGLMIHALK